MNCDRLFDRFSVLFFLYFCFNSVCLARNMNTLYSADDPLLQISGFDDFEKRIFGQNNINSSFFVEYYASWCGHCINFAPTFRKFTLSVLGWRKFVNIAVVNCVDEKNVELCRLHKVNMYPTLRYYKYGSLTIEHGVQVENGDETVEYLRKQLSQKLKEDPSFKGKLNMPSLQTMDKQMNEEQLWSLTDSQARHLVLIVEQEMPKIIGSPGLQTVLEFSDYSDQVGLFLLSNESHLAQKYSVSSAQDAQLPELIIFEKGETKPGYVSKEKHPTMEILRQRILFETNVKMKELVVTVQAISKPETKSKPAIKLFVHKLDLLSALRHIFYEEVRKFEHIRGVKLKILKDFMETVLKYFPANNREHNFLFELTSWLNSISSEMPSSLWVARLNQLQQANNNPLPIADQWHGCKGTEPKFRGFPCSLWLLFHVITVQAYQKDGTSPIFNPKEVLRAFKFFIREFFGCNYCAKNFQNETALLEQQVVKSNDVVLYLWRVHNDVNNRLKGKASEDPNFAKEQFPSPLRCPTCFKIKENRWNEEEVLKFLIAFYSRPSEVEISDFTMPTVLKSNIVEVYNKAISPDKPSSMFSFLDISICFVLWCVSVCAVFLVFYYFRRRVKHQCFRSMIKYNLV